MILQNHQQSGIESGYFVLTMMPSLRCSLNCPHCYLSLEQRRHSPVMALSDIAVMGDKVAAYYATKPDIHNKTIQCYWYGGEPTEMGLPYFSEAISILAERFPRAQGYRVRHTILTSLVTVDPEWYPYFKLWGDGYVQSSFDGLMRGKGYIKKWEKKAREVIDYGLRLGTISVVNREMIEAGPESSLDYLSDMGVVETSWLPFMWNEVNDGEKYNRYAPTMTEYSDFMIRLSQHWITRKQSGKPVPHVGQMSWVMHQGASGNPLDNVAAQTLFLLPNGDFALPDYKNGYQEYLRVFGNILESDFEAVLQSKERRSFLRKQVLKNNNPTCSVCQDGHRCLMEFWKDNRNGDDCFGAKKYMQWVDGVPVLKQLVPDDNLLY